MEHQSQHTESDNAAINSGGSSSGNSNGSNMNNNTITVADADARAKKPKKLRQTCDPCSEAKVKCDKGNPRCGRCDRLSYECVYSPARRIGRPRPRSPRAQDQENAGRTAREARDDAAAVMTDDGANKDCVAPVRQPSAPAQPPQRALTTRHPNLHLDETLPDCLSDEEGRWSAPASTSASASSTDRSNFRSNDAPQSTNMTMRDGFLEHPSSVGLDEVRHNPYEYDCATVAVATLSSLAAAGLDGQQSATTQTTQTTAAADVLADQIPRACRQAARILVCPCSADMDTALLAASLAAAILDVADAALRTLKPAGHALDDEQHTVLALGTIPTISQVVTLFTHRYSVTQASRPPEALLLLAASLRTMLKAMAEETTNRFLDSGAAPSSRVEVAANS